MYMTSRKFTIIIVVLLSLVGISIAALLVKVALKAKQTTIEDVQRNIQQKRAQVLEEGTSVTSSTSTSSNGQSSLPHQDEIAILLLGLDARYTTSTSRCDAIHMFVANIKNKTIKITSVPRGTYTPIPGYAEDQQYFSNLCSIMGHDYAIEQIEKFINQKADYVVKVDFSKSLGILRALKLPTTESLMWVRNRHSFGIGDHQRSHNQALFMKDVALKKISLFKSPALLPLAKILHSYVETDLDFESFYALLKYFAESDLGDHPERIELAMKPAYKTTDYHFDFNDPKSMQAKFPAISFDVITTTSTSSTDPSVVVVTTTTVPYRSLASVQNELIRFLNRRLKSPQALTDVINKKLWLQVEDEKTREVIHFKIIERLLQEDTDIQTKMGIITDYIQEKEIFELTEWATKGRELMRRLVGLIPPTRVYPAATSTSSTGFSK